MLQKLVIKNFRLLRDVEIEFDQEVPTVLIGPNGSGKSTVLEVLDFIARCGESGLEAAVVAHGGLDGIRTAGGTDDVELETIWGFSSSAPAKRPWNLTWTVSLAQSSSGSVVIRRESLSDMQQGGNRRELVTTDEDGRRLVFPDDTTPEKPSVAKPRTKLAFEAIVDPSRFKGLSYLRLLAMSLRVLGALSVAPAWARTETQGIPSPRDSLVIAPKQFLDRQGLGLANVLYSLQSDHAEAWTELERAFRAEFPYFQRIVFPADVAGGKIAFAVEDSRYPERKFYAWEMSDGMIAYLCLLVAVLHPDQIGVIGLDEPDAHLHPSALRRLMSLAHRPHNKRKLVIVSHSNALLDELADPARSIRIVEASANGAVIRRLDPEALASWRKEYSLSEMRRTGLLDASNANSKGSE